MILQVWVPKAIFGQIINDVPFRIEGEMGAVIRQEVAEDAGLG
jgi:hypothetical protein